MRGKILSHGLGVVLAISAVALFATTASAAASETVLHNLNNDGTAAAYPCAGLIMDASGNFYGTTCYGGLYNAGTVFELTPNQGRGWTETVLHSFGNGTDGSVPEAGLIFDANGNLYGTTSFGGIHDGGTAFELTPTGGGDWTETVLRNFGGGTDGAIPFSGLVFDANGNLFGTTYQGGIHNHGTVFQLAPRQGGGWTETVLHSFNNNGSDGALPEAGLVFDPAGNLYGTTSSGGIHDYGTVFELAVAQGGGWTETILHSFNMNGSDGAFPEAGLVIDNAGNLYGTTEEGGIHLSYGTVFKLTPRDGGGWTETILHPETGGLARSLVLDGPGDIDGADLGRRRRRCGGDDQVGELARGPDQGDRYGADVVGRCGLVLGPVGIGGEEQVIVARVGGGHGDALILGVALARPELRGGDRPAEEGVGAVERVVR